MLTQKVVSDFIAEQRRCSSSVVDALQNVRKQILHLHECIPRRHELLHTCQNDTKNMATMTHTNVNRILEDCEIEYENSKTCESEVLVDLFPHIRNNIVHSKHAGRLCRVRGMIQEIQNEMHLFSASRSNFFSTPQDESDEELLDAMLLYVIPVPGNLHFYESYNGDNASSQITYRNYRTTERQSETFISRSTASLEHDTNAAKSYIEPLMLPHLQESKANSDTSKNVNINDKVSISRKRWQTKRLDNEFDNNNAYKVKKELTMEKECMEQNEQSNLRLHYYEEEEEEEEYEEEELFESQEHREIKKQLCTAEKEQKGLFSLNSYLNLPHSALSRDLQSACIVTILAPKMHIEPFDDQNTCNGAESIHDEDEEKETDQVNSFNEYDNTSNTNDNHNGRTQLHVNDIVDFYGFIQEPESESPELLESEHDSTNADKYNSSVLHRYEFNSSKLRNSWQDDCCDEEMECNNECNEECNYIAEFDEWRALQLSSLLVPRLICLAYVHVNSTPSSFTLSSCKEGNKLSDELKVEESEELSTEVEGLPCHSDRHYYYYEHPSRFALHACSCIAQMQPRVVEYLAHHICQGDMLLSEYLLLHLCGRIVAHTTITPVGDVPLCVYAPNMDAYTWSAALREIVPIAELLIDKSLLLASRMQLNPQHDMRENYLRTGLLQVGNGTHLTFNCDDLMSLFSGEDDLISNNDEVTTTTTTTTTTTRNNFNNRDVDSNNNNNNKGGIFAQENELSFCHTNWKDVLFSLLHKQVLLLDYPYQTLELPVDVSVLALCTSNTDNDNNNSPIITQSHKYIDSMTDNKQKNTSYTTIIPSLFDFALKLPWIPTSASLLRKAITEEDNSNSNSSNSQQQITTTTITTTTAAGNVLLTSHEVRAYLFTIRRINPCFDYEKCTEENETRSNDSSNDNERTPIHVAIAEAFTKMSTEMPQWVNRDALVHNNTFSAVTAMLRARAVSCGRSRVSRDDLEFVLSLERQRVKRLQQN